MFFPIITQASISVIIISVLAIIMGVLVFAANIGCLLFVKYERAGTFSKGGDYQRREILIVATV